MNGMVDLGSLDKNESSVATEVSANGRAIVGFDMDPNPIPHVPGGRRGTVTVDWIDTTDPSVRVGGSGERHQ